MSFAYRFVIGKIYPVRIFYKTTANITLMIEIKNTLQFGDQKEEVANLNSALLFLLGKGIISTDFQTHIIDVSQLVEAINQKRDLFSLSTQALIKLFQEQQELGKTGQVDQPTADKLNYFLMENGAFDQQTQYKVSGKVFNALKEPIPQQEIVAYDVDLRGSRIYKTV